MTRKTILFLAGILLLSLVIGAWVYVKLKPDPAIQGTIAAIESDFDVFAVAITNFAHDTHRFPKELSELMENPKDSDRWKGPYFYPGRPPKDPWGRSYRYEVIVGQEKVRIFTLGEDNMPGGDGLDADMERTIAAPW
jgi:general secretion pathway protein G